MKRQHPSRTCLALLVVGTLVAGACGGGDDDGSTSGPENEGTGAGDAIDALGGNIVVGPQDPSGDPVTGGSLTVGVESETNSYLPSIFQGSQAGFNVAYAVFDPLFTRDADGEIVPYLAESAEPNDDFTEWTITLRPDVEFHDGTPLDAEAMKRIFDEFLTAEGTNTAGALLREVSSLDVVDDLTVRYVLNQPNAAWPDTLALQPGWPFSPTAAAELGDAFGDQPVGTGPFRFVSWQRDGSFVVERNPDYWQEGLPYLDEITFRPIPDEETRATSLSSGDIDAAQSVRLSSFLSRVVDIPDVEVALGLGNGGGNMMFNVTAPPVDDVRIRQALAYAVDQQALIEVVAGEAAVATEPRSQFFWSENPYYSDAVAEAWPTYDLEQAQALYDEYVNDPDRSDGREVGEPVAFSYDCTNVPSLIEQATALQGFWEEVGFEVEVNPLEQSAHITGAVTGEYQAKCYRAGADADPLTTLENAFGDPEAFVTNLTDYTNETVDETLQTLRTSGDLETRQAAVEEAGLQLAEDLPYIWTGSDLPFIAYREGVHGVASWGLPDGSLGDGAAPGISFWSQVWVE
ncbi:MAG: ABC transporter substrate-binding protein [Acidimicrobiales bacterium]